MNVSVFVFYFKKPLTSTSTNCVVYHVDIGRASIKQIITRMSVDVYATKKTTTKTGRGVRPHTVITLCFRTLKIIISVKKGVSEKKRCPKNMFLGAKK